MPRLVTALLTAGLLTGVAATARAVPDQDLIGLYADAGGQRTAVSRQAGEEFELYLLLVHPSDPAGVHAWECLVEVPANVTILEWRLAGQALSLFAPPTFMVGLGQPLREEGGGVLLATARCVAGDQKPALFRLRSLGTSSVSPPAPAYAPGDLERVGSLVTLTSSSGSADAPVFGVNTGEDQVSQPVLPRILALHPNTPNPFNPRTTIAFDLPRPVPVTLAVFDLAGRQVATLVQASLPAGTHEVQWDGRDDRGLTVASGTYVYQLQTPDAVISHKLTLLK